MKKILIIALSLFAAINVSAQTNVLNAIEINIEKERSYSITIDQNDVINAEKGEKASTVLVSNDWREYRRLNAFYANQDGTLILNQYLVLTNDENIVSKYDKLVISTNSETLHIESLKNPKKSLIFNNENIFVKFNSVEDIPSNIRNIVLIDVDKRKAEIKESMIVATANIDLDVTKKNFDEKVILNYNNKYQDFSSFLFFSGYFPFEGEELVAQSKYDFVTAELIKSEGKIQVLIKRLADVTGDIILLADVSNDGSTGYNKPIILKDGIDSIILEY